jgi:hypothetical protein
MQNFLRIRDNVVFTECELYACLMNKCCYECNAGWNFENLDTLEIKTGQNWKTYFRQNPPSCSCNDPLCPSGRELEYLNIIESVTCINSGSGIRVTLNEATYIDLSSDPPLVPEYTIDWGDGSDPENISIGIQITHDISGLADEVYVGSISWADATFGFYYQVVSGEITALQISSENRVTYNIGCDLYPNYEINVTQSASVEGTDNFVSSRIRVFNVLVSNEVYTTEKSFTENGQLLTNLDVLSNRIVYNFATTLVGGIDNTAILRTRCIS